MGSSTAIPTIAKQYFAITVGFLATVATILGGLSSTFKWNSKEDAFGQAAQQFQILESKLRFAKLSGEDCGEKFREIQDVVIDISKGMRFFPPEDKVKQWEEKGLLDETQKIEAIPKIFTNHKKDLFGQGINEKSDFKFITKEILDELNPPMNDRLKAKAFQLKTEQGGNLKGEEEKILKTHCKAYYKSWKKKKDKQGENKSTTVIQRLSHGLLQ
jgi:hypothetical protein